jgi:hypothetical protein
LYEAKRLGRDRVWALESPCSVGGEAL